MASILTAPRWIRGSLLALAWLGVWGLGHLAEFSAHASIWYPPAAMTFAALVVVGVRAVPYLFVASMAATVWSSHIYPTVIDWPEVLAGGIANAIVHIGCYGIGAAWLRRIAERQQHSLPRIVMAFLAIATAASIATTVGVLTTLVSFDMLDAGAVAGMWLAFWVGDFVALVVLGPLFTGVFLKLTRSPSFWIKPLGPIRKDRLNGPFAAKLLVNGLVVTAAMVMAAHIQSVESAFLIFFLMIPQMWLTHSESPMRTALSLGAISLLIVLWLSLLELTQFVLIYQFAIAIVATTAYFGLAIPLLASDNERLRERLMFDRLTGAASRDLLMHQARRELDRVARGAVSCIAVVDLDDFKAVNDRDGHAAGDRALVAVAHTLRRGLSATDVVARFGGDEFVLILPDTPLERAVERLATLQSGIRQEPLVEDFPLTISIGVAAAFRGDTFKTWFERADAALLTAKRAGRDRLRVAMNSIEQEQD